MLAVALNTSTPTTRHVNLALALGPSPSESVVVTATSASPNAAARRTTRAWLHQQRRWQERAGPGLYASAWHPDSRLLPPARCDSENASPSCRLIGTEGWT